MANEDPMFSFEMMNAAPLDWARDVHTNELHRCSQTTLSQLQEKVLRSLSKRNEDDNLQVVPQNDVVYEEISPISYLRESCAVRCRENRAKKELIENFSVPCSGGITDKTVDSNRSLPCSSNLRKTPLLAITTCSSTEPLRTPTFPFSPLLKSPALCTKAPVSPLAMMILSPFGRKPSEDLSVYLPENFTPAATLERLESSISTTVFEFPSVEVNQNSDKQINVKKEKHKNDMIDAEEVDLSSPEDVFHGNTHNALNDGNETRFAHKFKKETDYNFEEHCDLTQKKGVSKKRKNNENRDHILGFRNTLERKRRSEMNSKYDKLQQCIPEIEKRQKVAKIFILRSAMEYIQELQRQDKLLIKEKNMEKLRNEELLKKLIRISS